MSRKKWYNPYRNLRENHNVVQETSLTSDEIRRLDKYYLHRNQCMYISDHVKHQMDYRRNFEILGYTDEEVRIADVYAYHPEDRELVETVTRAAMKFAFENSVEISESVFCLTYRLMKKDGTYIKVLRQSTVFSIDDSGRMASNLSVLTDIDFIYSPGYVNWFFDIQGVDPEIFVREVGKAVYDMFTPKELEIIPMLVAGDTSPIIAEKLFISRHTVDTHRRSILRKSGCSNIFELVQFATKNKLI